MSFKDLRDAVYTAHHFNTDWFAETVTFQERLPGQEPSRTRSIVVHVDDKGTPRMQGASYQEVDTLIVLINRDADTGTLDPEFTRIKRSAERDPEQRWYNYVYEHDEQHDSKWRLVYERQKQRTEGAIR